MNPPVDPPESAVYMRVAHRTEMGEGALVWLDDPTSGDGLGVPLCGAGGAADRAPLVVPEPPDGDRPLGVMWQRVGAAAGETYRPVSVVVSGVVTLRFSKSTNPGTRAGSIRTGQFFEMKGRAVEATAKRTADSFAMVLEAMVLDEQVKDYRVLLIP